MKQPIFTPPLKNCKCGSTNLRERDMASDFHHNEFQIVCMDCGEFAPKRGAKSIHRAICKWNNHQKEQKISQ